MTGVRHLIECVCTLPQFRHTVTPVYHKFPVFSVIEDDGSVRSKHVKCTNCGAVHKVDDLCRSEMILGAEDSQATITVDDVRLTLPRNVSELLIKYDVDVSIWEEVQFIYENKHWGRSVTLVTNNIDGKALGKVLKISSFDKIEILPFSREDVVS